MKTGENARNSLEKKAKNLWFAILLMVAALLLCVSLTVRSIQLSYAIQKAERRIDTAREERDLLRIEMDRLTSLDRVHSVAHEKLGLDLPAKEDVVVIQLEP